MLTLSDIFPPIPTPFDAEGNILHDKLRANLARWCETRLHGFVVLGSNGEYVHLTPAEKFAVWETARDAIPRDRLFIAGTGADFTRAAVELAHRAAELGADAALVVTPHYYKARMNLRELTAHYFAIADASPIPIIAYNVPANTGVDIDAATILKLAEHPNIAGIKDSSGNFAKMGLVLANVRGDFAFLAGTGGILYPALCLGAWGCVPALGNIAPREMVQIFDDFHAGNHDAARALQQKLIALNLAVTSKYSVPGLKAALDMLGYYGGPPRLPLLPLSDAERADLRQTMVEAGLVIE
jgi:4-hydroxy-2-oxoglutarate aldolase